MGRVQQRFGWNTTDIETGAPQRRAALVRPPFVDTQRTEAKLRRANCRDVATWATSNHDNIKTTHEIKTPGELIGSLYRVSLVQTSD